ncbi:furin repeat-containing protein, putative [Entamoeba invadens IP1]|uniref:Furin repeat-containing protein, putative n=1 Tax=Entamoeba invadens IP1 TaxID=370355 RepID=A0A0A1TXZ4_ENTIV|nr:furin repeat-containing protein, putative [Entamoeba invadens IP1]ELP86318.1 furin repeat-containing protein, putative [Entamoeba invadens IP1]|eukprot:XP_004185664.1 furin repeat-containing protein, putative [Entamoeba invadens IP1]
MNGNTCEPCDLNCLTCTSATECDACINPNRKPTPGNKCDGCNEGYYWDADKQNCFPCFKNCDVCKDSTTCEKCTVAGNFESSPNSEGKCRCVVGYVYNETLDACDPCKENKNEFCSTCEKESCTLCNAEYLEPKGSECVCKAGYYTTSWGSCIPCDRHISGCLLCEEKDKCSKCNDGYKLNQTTGRCDGAWEITVALFVAVMILFI